MPNLGDVGNAWFDPEGSCSRLQLDFLHLEPFVHLQGSVAGKDRRKVERLIAKVIGRWLPEDPTELPQVSPCGNRDIALVLRLAGNSADGVEEPLEALSVTPLEGYSGQLLGLLGRILRALGALSDQATDGRLPPAGSTWTPPQVASEPSAPSVSDAAYKRSLQISQQTSDVVLDQFESLFGRGGMARTVWPDLLARRTPGDCAYSLEHQ